MTNRPPNGDAASEPPAADAGRRRVGDVLPSPAEARLFWRLRFRVLAARARQAMQVSRLRMTVLVVLSAVFWGGLYVLFAEGFGFLTGSISHGPTQVDIVQKIFNVFFVSLLAMLTVSAAIILYSGLYRSEEVAFLLTTPASTRRIVIHKFQEAVLFSCWGFLLLGSPMLVAYGVQVGAPWYYYVMMLPFMISFVFIPAGIGAILCLLVVYCLPAIRVYALAVAGTVLLAAAIVVGATLLGGADHDLMTPLWFKEVLARLQFTEQRLLPSWWLSSGLLEAAHNGGSIGEVIPWRESAMFLAVLISNALLLSMIVFATGDRVFRTSYSRLQGLLPPRRLGRPATIDRIIMGMIWPLPMPVRLLIVKDVRLFRRDPVQWSQFLIFFGLLALYFINVRSFQYGDRLRGWMTMIGFLNVGVAGLILSTFTTRFIFPLISLEGRRFWILGSLPVKRDTILWSKFLFACGGSVVPCATLILLSDIMLGIMQYSPFVAAIHQLTCWVLCIGLSAIAVGLGARLPNLRELSPSKIAAGFGGTLNLVLSAVFIVSVVLATAVPCYYLLDARENGAATAESASALMRWFGPGTTGMVGLGIAVMLLLGAVATIAPLRLGLKAFRELET